MEVRGFTRAGLGKGGGAAKGGWQRDVGLWGFAKGDCDRGVGKEMLAYGVLQREFAKGGWQRDVGL